MWKNAKNELPKVGEWVVAVNIEIGVQVPHIAYWDGDVWNSRYEGYLFHVIAWMELPPLPEEIE